MKDIVGTGAFRRTLRNPNYGIYTLGNAASLIGTWVQRVAVGWLIWQMTRSEAWLGAIAFADLFPTVLIGPFAGVVADRFDRLKVLKTSQRLLLLQSVMLYLLTAAGAIGPECLLVLTFFGGAVTAFNQPARLALISSLVTAEDMTTAIAINSTVFNAARFVGPAAAGAIIAAAGVPIAFAANAATFAIFLLALERLRLPPSARRVGLADRSVLVDVGEGIIYIVHHPGMAPLFLLLIVSSVAARPVVELLPGFSDVIFDAGAGGLAMMTSAIGLGAIASGVWMVRRGRPDGLTRVVFAHTAILGAAILVFATTDHLAIALAALVVAGAGMVGGGIAAQTLIQLSVDTAVRGRVLSLYGLIFRGGPAVGALADGMIAEKIGLQWPVGVGGGLAILCVAWLWGKRAHRIRLLERTPQTGD